MSRNQDLIFVTVLLLGIFFSNIGAHGHGNKHKDKKIAMWESLLYHHRQWAGYYSHNQTRFMCSMIVHSVNKVNSGKAMVTFVSEGLHIDMEGTSPDGESVVFHEHHVWEKSSRFAKHPSVIFDGKFKPDVSYYSYEAKVHPNRRPDIVLGSITLIPHGRPVSDKPKGKRGKNHMGLVVGVPLLIGVIVLTLAGFIMAWAVRKGYLRHVPWSYKSFQTPKEWRLEMEREMKVKDNDESQQEIAVIVGSEKAAMHI